eukprot:3768013-Prymnesium_polylepis.1
MLAGGGWPLRRPARCLGPSTCDAHLCSRRWQQRQHFSPPRRSISHIDPTFYPHWTHGPHRKLVEHRSAIQTLRGRAVALRASAQLSTPTAERRSLAQRRRQTISHPHHRLPRLPSLRHSFLPANTSPTARSLAATDSAAPPSPLPPCAASGCLPQSPPCPVPFTLRTGLGGIGCGSATISLQSGSS